MKSKDTHLQIASLFKVRLRISGFFFKFHIVFSIRIVADVSAGTKSAQLHGKGWR